MFISRHSHCKLCGGQIYPREPNKKDSSVLRQEMLLLAIVKGLTVTQDVLDSNVSLLPMVLSALRADTHVWVGGGKKLRPSDSNLPRTLWVCWPAMAAPPRHLPRRPHSQECQDAPSLRFISALAAPRSVAGNLLLSSPGPRRRGQQVKVIRDR